MSKILLIEDDFYIANLYVDVLTKNNFEVLTAADGQSALDAILKQQFDLILLDLMLPDMNGRSILEAIHNKNLHVAPIILLTNVAQETVIDKCKSLGACGYILKSEVLPHDLVKTITNFLQTGIFTIQNNKQ